MRKILSMTRKDFLLWAKQPGSWITVFVLPIILIWILYSVFSSSGAPVVMVYAVNEDESQESKQVMQALRDADHLIVKELETRQEADQRVGAGGRIAALVIPEGFGSALKTAHGTTIEVIIDPDRAEQANIVIGLANAALAPLIVDAEVSRGVEPGVVSAIETYQQITPEANQTIETAPTEYLFPTPTVDVAEGGTSGGDQSGGDTEQSGASGGTETPGDIPGGGPFEDLSGGGESEGEIDKSQPDLETVQTFFAAAVKGVVSSQVQEALNNPQIQVKALPSEETEDVHRPSLLDYLVPGCSLLFVYFLIPSLALSVIEERRTGALRRLLVAPLSRSQVFLGKMLPYFLIGVAQFVFVLLASRLLFGLDLGDSPLALGIVIISSALAMAGLGILIAAFTENEGQANGLAIVIMLAMAVVSGAVIPGIAVPGLQKVIPHYWSMQGFLNVFLYGQGVAGVLGPAGVLLTMSAIFFTIGAVRSRLRENQFG